MNLIGEGDEMKPGCPKVDLKKIKFDRNAYQSWYRKQRKLRSRNKPEACVLRLFVEGK